MQNLREKNRLQKRNLLASEQQRFQRLSHLLFEKKVFRSHFKASHFSDNFMDEEEGRGKMDSKEGNFVKKIFAQKKAPSFLPSLCSQAIPITKSLIYAFHLQSFQAEYFFSSPPLHPVHDQILKRTVHLVSISAMDIYFCCTGL